MYTTPPPKKKKHFKVVWHYTVVKKVHFELTRKKHYWATVMRLQWVWSEVVLDFNHYQQMKWQKHLVILYYDFILNDSKQSMSVEAVNLTETLIYPLTLNEFIFSMKFKYKSNEGPIRMHPCAWWWWCAGQEDKNCPLPSWSRTDKACVLLQCQFLLCGFSDGRLSFLYPKHFRRKSVSILTL